MIIGIGTDLCDIGKIEENLKDDRFLQRFFDAEEIAYIKNKNKAGAQSAAGIFAAKEAALKAFGTGLTTGALKEIIVLHNPKGAPYYGIKGTVKTFMENLGGKKIHLSISHEGKMAVAMAVLEGEG